MPAVNKVALKEEYDGFLEESPNFIMTRFTGLDVAQLTDLRSKLHEKGIQYRVVKNRIFKLSLRGREVKGFPYDELRGPIGVVFPKEDMPTGAKILKDFAKEHEPFEIMSGVMESNFYDVKAVESLANLPSKEQLLATIAVGLNSPATKIAVGVKEVMASLARAIQAVGEKND